MLSIAIPDLEPPQETEQEHQKAENPRRPQVLFLQGPAQSSVAPCTARRGKCAEGRRPGSLSARNRDEGCDAADGTLRQFARWVTATSDIATVAAITRTNVEDYKVWLAAQPGCETPTLARTPNANGCG